MIQGRRAEEPGREGARLLCSEASRRGAERRHRSAGSVTVPGAHATYADSPGLPRRPEAAGMWLYCPGTHTGCWELSLREKGPKSEGPGPAAGVRGGLPPLLRPGLAQTKAAQALSRPWRERPAERRQRSELRPWALSSLPLGCPLPAIPSPPDLSGKNEGRTRRTCRLYDRTQA